MAELRLEFFPAAPYFRPVIFVGRNRTAWLIPALCAGALVLGPLHGAESPTLEQLKAAALKDPKAQYQLGQLYASGKSVPQNFETAVTWFKKAANADNPDALYSLGFCHATGTGVSKSLSKAASYYLDAAKLGHSEAQFKVAVCYEKGIGFQRPSAAEAMKWYRQAAERGVAEAQCVLGNHARAAHNYNEAVKWYNLAAVRGVASAQYELAILHRNGQGVEKKDMVEAYKWFALAAENGYEQANQQMEELPKLYGMTSEQVTQGQQKARAVQDQLQTATP
jgi:TPR repeat protein